MLRGLMPAATQFKSTTVNHARPVNGGAELNSDKVSREDLATLGAAMLFLNQSGVVITPIQDRVSD